MYAGVYVGTYKKYNEGSLFGKWLDMSDYDSYEDFIAACKELHKDEVEPEFLFQDFEFDSKVRPLLEQLVTESHVDPRAWDVFDLDSEDLIYVSATWEYYNDDLSVEEALKVGKESYIGKYDSEPKDYAYEYLEETLRCIPNSVDPETGDLCRSYKFILGLLNLDKAVRELKYDGYIFTDGYVFQFR